MHEVTPPLSNLRARLNRAVNRGGPQHPEARRVCAKATTRDMHPTKGSAAIMQAASSGTGKMQISSLNTLDGSRAFMFGVAGFGWGEGVIEP